jgi:hypothetical protein
VNALAERLEDNDRPTLWRHLPSSRNAFDSSSGLPSCPPDEQSWEFMGQQSGRSSGPTPGTAIAHSPETISADLVRGLIQLREGGLIIEGSDNENWLSCHYQPSYPSHQRTCEAVAAFRCDGCRVPVCLLHVRIELPPAMRELCSPCCDRERAIDPRVATQMAAAVARRIVRQCAHARERRPSRAIAWLVRTLRRLRRAHWPSDCSAAGVELERQR